MVKNKKDVVHSFILILVTAATKNEIDYLDIDKKKRLIISSDYLLIKRDLEKEIKLKNLFTRA